MKHTTTVNVFVQCSMGMRYRFVRYVETMYTKSRNSRVSSSTATGCSCNCVHLSSSAFNESFTSSSGCRGEHPFYCSVQTFEAELSPSVQSRSIKIALGSASSMAAEVVRAVAPVSVIGLITAAFAVETGHAWRTAVVVSTAPRLCSELSMWTDETSPLSQTDAQNSHPQRLVLVLSTRVNSVSFWLLTYKPAQPHTL